MISAKILLLFVVAGVCTALPFRRVINAKQVETLVPRAAIAWIRKGAERLHCGATFVSDNYVITAASCIKRQNLTGVVGGDFDLTAEEDGEQYRNIAETIIHPGYNETTYEHDIALLKLEYPIELTDHIKPIPFLTPDADIMYNINIEDIYGKHCRVAGWGKPKPCLKGAVFANPLEEIVVDRVNDTDCDSVMSNRPSTTLCFHPFRRPDLSSTCLEDIGGPYLCKIRTKWYLLGVISAWNTDEVCSPGFKGATKLPAYGPWIQSVIGPLQTTTPLLMVDPYDTTPTLMPTDIPDTTIPITDANLEITTAEAEVTTAETEITTAEAEVTTAEAEVTTAEAEVTTAEAEVTTAEAEVSTAESTTSNQESTDASGEVTTAAPTGVAETTTGAQTAAPTNAAETTTGAQTAAPTNAAETTTGAQTAAPTNAAETTTGAQTAAPTNAAETTTGGQTAPPTNAAETTNGAQTASPTNAAETTTLLNIVVNTGAAETRPGAQTAVTASTAETPTVSIDSLI